MTQPEPTEKTEQVLETHETNAHDIALDLLRKQVDEWKDKALRSVAEAENVRKRAERDVQETQKYAVANFAKDMIGVAENLIRALGSVPEESLATADALFKTVYTGVDLTLKELLGVFERNGLKRIDPMGQKFDHNLHQAIAQVDAPQVEPNTVVQVVQAGYVMHDRLLRPAMVAVAKAESQPKPSVDTVA